jgi:glyceraldehyde 3-phosphate dehydrogenase
VLKIVNILNWYSFVSIISLFLAQIKSIIMSNNLADCIVQYRDQRYECLTITLFSNILWKDRDVLCLFYGHSLVDEKVDFLLKFYNETELPKKIDGLNSILRIIKELIQLPELPSVIDIGLLKDSLDDGQLFSKESLIAKLWYIHLNNNTEQKHVVLYGFGRIGRLLARELCTDPALQINLDLRAVVTRDPININYLRKRASLLQRDSIHGPFKGRVDVDEDTNSLIINGKQVRFISTQESNDINYMMYGIRNAILIDNTGKHRDYLGLSKHLKNGAISKIVVTAPGKDIPNIVFGVNEKQLHDTDTKIFSTASCTTNAITPVLSIIEKEYGIEKGHIETIHSYTNDQNLVDNIHTKSRRGRAAAINMVITETGAGKAVSKIVPQLKDKLTSSAIRVPMPNGALAILVLNLKKKTSIGDLHNQLIQAASSPAKNKQIDFSYEDDLVSSDIIGNRASGIVDGCATSISSDGRTITLYVWYDNEYGYCMQVLGFTQWLSTKFGENMVPSQSTRKDVTNLLINA